MKAKLEPRKRPTNALASVTLVGVSPLKNGLVPPVVLVVEEELELLDVELFQNR